ncbi:MAG: hypothetical protein WCG48_03665 [Candidatus Berkelbacteria bacterium]
MNRNKRKIYREEASYNHFSLSEKRQMIRLMQIALVGIAILWLIAILEVGV